MCRKTRTIDEAIYTAIECVCHASPGVCVKFGEQLNIPKQPSKNSRFVFVTYTIIQNIISSEMYVISAPWTSAII